MVRTKMIQTWDVRTLAREQALAIGELIAQVWPKPNVGAVDRAEKLLELGRQFPAAADPGPRSFVILDGDRVVAHAALLPRRIGACEGSFTIGGLSRVCSDPAARGQRLGEAVTRAAFDAIDAGEFPFALFQTNGRVRAFYEKLGAVVVENDFVNSLAADSAARPFWDELVMRYPADRHWPAGEIDLLGPGF